MLRYKRKLGTLYFYSWYLDAWQNPMHSQKRTLWGRSWRCCQWYTPSEGAEPFFFLWNQRFDDNFNGTKPHVVTLFQTSYPGRVLSEWWHHWLPRSSDLIPIRFFLWVYLKERVYVNKSAGISENIGHAISEIEGHLWTAN